jgi:replication initiation and membrane attachment protein
MKGEHMLSTVWKQLRPIDRYKVRLTQRLELAQLRLLNLLYQPLMGPVAMSLYLTLSHEPTEGTLNSEEKNHHHLMNIMNAQLDHIYYARLRLEALGLLRTYQLSGTELPLILEYELMPPLVPHRFFNDDILSICLYNQIGTQCYKVLRSCFAGPEASPASEEEASRKEISKEFHEVFSSIHPSELVAIEGTETEAELDRMNQQYPLTEEVEWQMPAYERYPLDLEVLKGYLMKGLDVKAILTPEAHLLFKKLAFFYRLDEWSLSRLIHDALRTDDQLDLELLREKAKEMYRLQHDGKPPKLIFNVQPMEKRIYTQQAKSQVPPSEEEAHLARLESISPMELLEVYQGGGKVADADIRLIEELLLDYGLMPGVVNLLIEYILLTNEFKLPRALVTKVGAHWKRLGIENIKQAQELAKKEHQQYKIWKEIGQSAKGKGYTKSTNSGASPKDGRSQNRQAGIRKDTLPEWIKSSQPSAIPTPAGQESAAQSISEKEKQKRIESLLKALGEWEE